MRVRTCISHLTHRQTLPPPPPPPSRGGRRGVFEGTPHAQFLFLFAQWGTVRPGGASVTQKM